MPPAGNWFGCIGATGALVATGAGNGASFDLVFRSVRGSSCFCCCNVRFEIGGRFRSLF